MNTNLTLEHFVNRKCTLFIDSLLVTFVYHLKIIKYQPINHSDRYIGLSLIKIQQNPNVHPAPVIPKASLNPQ